ncbi:M48 family metallopeptidase [uncultured Microscilla sp.]|uniref:M48 family metallopeptidase n=1 Tax=uncultured Microscilla sp. TaxID=432653 RepID=UPI00260748EC|nr:M48 family metallopeptidase [uncultured Microscilla sp.]
MTPQNLLIIIIVILCFNELLSNLLLWLNLKNSPANLPQALESLYTNDEYQRSLAYKKAVGHFSLFTGTLSFVVTLMLIVTGGFAVVAEWVNGQINHPIGQTMAFFAVLMLANDVLTLPFQLYSTFVIEERFGFNKITPKTFIIDKVKGYVLGGILGGVLGFAFLYLVAQMQQQFWVYFWVVIAAFMVFMNMFYTSLIMPLFNKLTPLEEGELRTAIEQYCQKVSFPLNNLFVIDGSKRSTKANAFFSGMGAKKKVVLYDTLIQNHSTEELVAVLAHEVGHYKKKHIPVSMLISVLQIGLVLFILSWFLFNPALSQALGASSLNIGLNLMAFGFLYSPISMITSLFMNIFSRKNEYEADAYACTTYNSKALASALKKLSRDNLSNLTPHPAYVFFHYSHPPLLTRLKAMQEAD